MNETNCTKKDILYMREALKEADKADQLDEVPVGCVIVKNDIIIARGCNRRETDKDVTSHAEIVAIRSACNALDSWRLIDCEIYITFEPCIMCLGAIIDSRVSRMVYGAKDDRFDYLDKIMDIPGRTYSHNFTITSGVLADECSEKITNYFKNKRIKNI